MGPVVSDSCSSRKKKKGGSVAIAVVPGFTEWQYTYTDNGTWFIKVSAPVVLEPDYDVEINFQQFTRWTGTITYAEVSMLPL